MSNPYQVTTLPDLSGYVRESFRQQQEMLRGWNPPLVAAEPPGLSDAEVQRIAVAVVDEQERREASPLRVTAADVRRWIR